MPENLHYRVGAAQIFHENSKIRPVPTLEMVPRSINPEEAKWITQHSRKRFSRCRSLEVRGKDDGETGIGSNIRSRRSSRDFVRGSLSWPILSDIILGAFGVTSVDCGGYTFRAFPSAGGLFSLELFFICRCVNGVPKGLYYFDAIASSARCIGPALSDESVARLFCDQDIAKRASCIVLFGMNYGRMLEKYHDRGYRYALIEVGHSAQNLLLLASAHRISACNSGGFIDDEVNNLVKLDCENEGVAYACMLG